MGKGPGLCSFLATGNVRFIVSETWTRVNLSNFWTITGQKPHLATRFMRIYAPKRLLPRCCAQNCSKTGTISSPNSRHLTTPQKVTMWQKKCFRFLWNFFTSPSFLMSMSDSWCSMSANRRITWIEKRRKTLWPSLRICLKSGRNVRIGSRSWAIWSTRSRSFRWQASKCNWIIRETWSSWKHMSSRKKWRDFRSMVCTHQIELLTSTTTTEVPKSNKVSSNRTPPPPSTKLIRNATGLGKSTCRTMTMIAAAVAW